ncbi:hypothetical protein XFEB_00235 [Xylella fastidiosa EB92.1]|nr:hypothetical protein XFEB_00235 [Xylella fastidiosa EB92.1]
MNNSESSRSTTTLNTHTSTSPFCHSCLQLTQQIQNRRLALTLDYDEKPFLHNSKIIHHLLQTANISSASRNYESFTPSRGNLKRTFQLGTAHLYPQ